MVKFLSYFFGSVLPETKKEKNLREYKKNKILNETKMKTKKYNSNHGSEFRFRK